VSEQPQTFWNDLQPGEYGFHSNVNPSRPHPRWSQASERVLDTGDRIPTNGTTATSQVASLYPAKILLIGCCRPVRGARLFPWRAVDRIHGKDPDGPALDGRRERNVMTMLRQLSNELESLVARTTQPWSECSTGADRHGLVLAPDGWVSQQPRGARAPGAGTAGRTTQRSASALPTAATCRRGRRRGCSHRSGAGARRCGRAPASGARGAHPRTRRPARGGDRQPVALRSFRVARGRERLDRSLPAPAAPARRARTDGRGHQSRQLRRPLLDADGAVVGSIPPSSRSRRDRLRGPGAHCALVAAVLVQKGEVRRPILGVAASGVDLGRRGWRSLGQRARCASTHRHRFPAAPLGCAAGSRRRANGAPVASIDDLQRSWCSRRRRAPLDVLRGASGSTCGAAATALAGA